jgi:hypothetical protein
MKNLQPIYQELVFAPATAATTTAAKSIDTLGAKNLCVSLSFSANLNTNAAAPALQFAHSDTDAATAFATFDAALNRSVSRGTAGVISVSHINLDGSVKQYVQVKVTPGTTTNDTVIYGGVALKDKDIRPSAVADIGGSAVLS